MTTAANSIPINVRKTIHNIKEIAAGKHSDDDIYAMLKECNMDPNETAQKLLYLDTFHEVKSKRDRKKVKANSRIPMDYRLMSGMQRRGAAGNGCEKISTNYISDVNGRRYIKQQNGLTTLIPVAHKTGINNNVNARLKSTAKVSTNNNASHDSGVTLVVNADKLEKVSTLSPIIVNNHSNLNPGPTPAPTPTCIPTSTLVSGVYSSASDPVLLPTLNPRNSGTVGTIKREIGSQRTATEVIRTVNYKNTTEPKTSDGVSVTAIQPVVVIDGGSRQSKQVKVLPSQDATVAKRAHIPLLSKLNDSVTEQAVPHLDMKLDKLNISARQPVIFPNHLQVPESFRSGLTFGSLDPQSDPSIRCGEDSKPVETVSSNDRTSMETKRTDLRDRDSSAEAQRGDYTLSQQRGSENTSTFNVSNVYDQSKPDKSQPSAGVSQFPLLQSPPDYSLGFVPPMLGSHLVCIEGPEQQGGNISQAPSTSSSNLSMVQPPVGLGQSSVTMPSHLFPLVRQPYPPNYIPYNPYIPHLYMPQSAHQFLGPPSGFPQQPSSANFYMSPSVTTAGVKLPLPSLYKPAAISGNLNHFGFPNGYSSFGSSSISYSASPASVCTASNEDLTASELKEKNAYSRQKQNEDSQSRKSAPGRDQSVLQTNYFYNIPQDQSVGFAPAHSANYSLPGINPSQTVAAPSIVQPQTIAGSVESGAYQQPQANIHWNNKLLNRENI